MEDEVHQAIDVSDTLLSKCVSIDLEVDPNTNQIKSFAAIRPDVGEAFVYKRGNLTKALDAMDEFAEDAEFVVGHNIIKFDLPHLAATRPELALVRKRAIDTLWLNPIAFPRNPYHHLVKHYQDGRLQAGHASDPKLDAELVLVVLQNQCSAFAELGKSDTKALLAFHSLIAAGSPDFGFDAVFSAVRGAARPDAIATLEAIRTLLQDEACVHQIEGVVSKFGRGSWPLAYALAWISVAGGDSVMPPWVRHQFPQACELVRTLRDTHCSDPACSWCRTHNNPKALLKKWFGFEDFRQKPADQNGRSLQEAIVSTSINKTSVLGILPTGTGKSVCYQLPALAQFDKTGALTVVISPLVALMADQVASLKRQGISSCVTVNGLLSLPERHDVLDQVRLGDAAILLISPEQLRSPSVRSALNQREIGNWVLDEAHCISKWGHDFRPDYRYVARFIKEYSGGEPIAPLICLTATAKPDVVGDIADYFKASIGTDLKLIDGGTVRENLTFEVLPTSEAHKLGDVLAVLNSVLPKDGASGAVVYCSTRNDAERVAEFLSDKGFAAAHYHAGLKPERKLEVQQQFSAGMLRVIAATNAFGMGIDKPDIRVVVHSDIPGSLENYVQEAGRAGRDRQPARCILLFSGKDVEHQFRLSARSRLSRRDIAAILKSVRRLDRRFKQNGEVIATPGEILKEELEQEFERDSVTDDTRIKTAVSWLEEATLLKREENRVRVFPSSLKVRNLDEAIELINASDATEGYRKRLISLVRSLINAPADKGISTDELSGQSGLSPARLRKALGDLEALSIASNDTALTVFVHVAVEESSLKRIKEVSELETDLIRKLRELAPDVELGTTSVLNLKIASQELRDDGHLIVRPDIVEQLIRGIARDGRDEDEGIGSFQVRKVDREHLSLRLQRTWDKLALTAELRRKGAAVVLSSLIESAPPKSRGKDVQVETTFGTLLGALNSDLEIRQQIKESSRLLDRSLLWLHEQGVVTLGKGLTVFRPAITVHLEPGNKRFTEADFEPLQLHYDEQTLQIHIMASYAEYGLDSPRRSQELSDDYFMLDQQTFIEKWMPGRSGELRRQITPESWRAIIEDLRNKNQARIVSDDREQKNVLVLAGPGSGKTRVLVHRIAYLVRVRRENPRGILVLVYNRHAAAEIRRRLFDLIGDDARGVTISTCHGLAMRLIGASFARQADKVDADTFDEILKQAVSLLRGDGLSRDEAEAQRETLIEGYRWILVDEYQDIGADEYELIAAVAGRSIEDEDSRLSLFAVGDDDQNIYAFSGASVKFIRRFEQDYKAQPLYLIENYRSTANIIHAANSVIAPAAERMKVGHEIGVNQARKNEPSGGQLEKIDTVGRGRVQIIRHAGTASAQSVLAINELERLSQVVPEWNWAKTAVIAREWKYLQPVRSYCEAKGIPVQSADADPPNFWRLREAQTLVSWLKSRVHNAVHCSELRAWMDNQPVGSWWTILREGVEEFAQELGDRESDRRDVLEWLAEWGREVRKRQSGLLLLSAHRAKGLEFDDVIVLDGGWDTISRDEDRDAARRLYYVAMTRARRSLALVSLGTSHPIIDDLKSPSVLDRAKSLDPNDLSLCNKNYQVLNLSEVDLGFAGRLAHGNPSLDALTRLEVGDRVNLHQEKDRWLITNDKDVPVGRLAKKFAPPHGAQFVEGSVFAISIRYRSDGAQEYNEQLKRDEWSVVLPGLIFQV